MVLVNRVTHQLIGPASVGVRFVIMEFIAD